MLLVAQVNAIDSTQKLQKLKIKFLIVINILLLLDLANLSSRNFIDDLIKKINFDEKLRQINNEATSNKAKHVEAEKKLNDHITSYTKLINDL